MKSMKSTKKSEKMNRTASKKNELKKCVVSFQPLAFRRLEKMAEQKNMTVSDLASFLLSGVRPPVKNRKSA